MIPFEAEIAMMEAKAKTPGRFKKLCQDVFGSPQGSELLYILYSVAHPANHVFRTDAREAAHFAGWCEITAALWRNASPTLSCPQTELEPTPPNEPNEKKRKAP